MEAIVEWDAEGRMRIRVGDVAGEYQDYHNIASLVLICNGKIEIYIAVTDYGLGCPPLRPEVVYKVVEVG